MKRSAMHYLVKRMFLARKNNKGILPCKINKAALHQLCNDPPEKKRRVYLEFIFANSPQILFDLETAGFDMDTIKLRKKIMLSHSKEGFSCLVTGTAKTIIRFLAINSKVTLASIDLSEYARLSSCH